MTFDITMPLQYDNCDNSGTAFQIHDGKRQIAIVEVAEIHGDVEGDGVTGQPRYEDIPTGEAYAKLFTAAPALLKVLKRARQYVVDGTLREADDDFTGRLLLDALDAAIEKAGAP